VKRNSLPSKSTEILKKSKFKDFSTREIRGAETIVGGFLSLPRSYSRGYPPFTGILWLIPENLVCADACQLWIIDFNISIRVESEDDVINRYVGTKPYSTATEIDDEGLQGRYKLL